MKNYRSRYELKRTVKDILHNNRKQASLLYMIPMFIIIFTGSASRHIPDIGTFDQFYIIKAISVSLIVNLILGMVFLLIRQSADFKGLDWLRDPDENFNPLRSNFNYFRSPDWWKLILTYLLMSIFTLLWSILLVIPGIIKSIAYSQTYFVYKDLNDKGLGDKHSLTDAITISRQLMNGNKWRYFVLQLSFIGWWFLSGIIASIGSLFGPFSTIVSTLLLALYMLWFYPYFSLTLANFYQDLAEQNPELIQ